MAWFEAAVKSSHESCFAAATAGEPCTASEAGLVGEGLVERDLKCFERRTPRCEGSWRISGSAWCGCRPTL